MREQRLRASGSLEMALGNRLMSVSIEASDSRTAPHSITRGPRMSLLRRVRRPRGSTGAPLLPAVLAAGAGLRFAALSKQSFWFDEALTVGLVKRGPFDMLHHIPGSEADPPLYYVLAWVWRHFFGTGEAGLRSLSAVAGTAAIPVAWAAGRELVSSRVG